MILSPIRESGWGFSYTTINTLMILTGMKKV
jgi:hypothetical protein